MVAGHADDRNAGIGQALHPLVEFPIGLKEVVFFFHHIAGEQHRLDASRNGGLHRPAPSLGGAELTGAAGQILRQPRGDAPKVNIANSQ